MNVKKAIAVALLGLLVLMGVACSGGGPTPTRTPRAVAENATQTPWIVYVSVTNTPEPLTVTPLPTVTSSKPTAAPTSTRRPATPQKPQPTRIISTPAPTAIPASPTPACIRSGQVTNTYFPENGATRNVNSKGGGGGTIQFMWDPITTQKLDSKMGYMVYVKAPGNQAARYVSHNGYLAVQNENGLVLDARAAYGLTLPLNQDVQVTWTVSVVQSNAGFDDVNFAALGPVIFCGPASPPSIINLHVVG